jgi:hypothetical protein
MNRRRLPGITQLDAYLTAIDSLSKPTEVPSIGSFPGAACYLYFPVLPCAAKEKAGSLGKSAKAAPLQARTRRLRSDRRA